MASQADEAARPRDRRRREQLLDTPDPVEMAMGAVASGKPIPDVARRVLEQQALLIRAQVAELRLRHVGEWVRAVLWGMLALAALAVAGLVAAVVLRAARTDALVIQPFDVPPALAAQGLTGKVIAGQVLDRLATLQQRSESTRPATSYANNWGDEIKIEIPNTGASTDQVWKLLRGWLGKETRISGEIIDTGDSLTLSARVGTQPAERFAGKPSDLDALVTQAAELIYKQTQPYRYAISLAENPERAAEAEQILRSLTRHPSAIERKWAYNGLSVRARARGDYEQSLSMARQALAMDKAMVPAASNIGSTLDLMGRDQAMVDAYDRAASLSTKGYDRIVTQANTCTTNARIGITTRDPARLAQASDCLGASASRQGDMAPYYRAMASLYRHEPPIASFLAGSSLPPTAAMLLTTELTLRAALDEGTRERIDAALVQYREAEAARSADPAFPNGVLPTRMTRQVPLQAQALAALGLTAQAQDLIAATPTDCYTCVRTRGLIAQAAGDRAGAVRWFAQAVRQGPRLAPAYVDWGRLQAEQGRHVDAGKMFDKAAKLSPSWADPLKYAGDALAAQGQGKEALAKYRQALKLAPRWPALQRAYQRAGAAR